MQCSNYKQPLKNICTFLDDFSYKYNKSVFYQALVILLPQRVHCDILRKAPHLQASVGAGYVVGPAELDQGAGCGSSPALLPPRPHPHLGHLL